MLLLLVMMLQLLDAPFAAGSGVAAADGAAAVFVGISRISKCITD